jgi:hypothetical protein
LRVFQFELRETRSLPDIVTKALGE